MKFLTCISICLLVLASVAQAQNERRFVRQGNKLYEKALADTTRLDTATFSLAETAYRRALEKRPDDPYWNFNLANTQYKQMQFDQAAATFKELAANSENKIEKSRSLHNLGNSLLFQNKIDESIEAYKEALRNNPNDLDTKYNLLYAQRLKKQQDQQQQQQNQDQQQDQQQDQSQDQQQNQDQDQQQNQEQQRQTRISRENAERMLQALQNDEQKIQERLKKQEAEKAESRRPEKEW